MKRIFLFAVVFISSVWGQNEIIKRGNTYYLSNTVIIKLKPEATLDAGRIREYLNKNIKGIKIQEAVRSFKESNTSLYKGENNLSRIYTLIIDNQNDPQKTAKKISQLKNIEWAEPKYVRKLVADLPDDTLYAANQQPHLARIHAPEAWNISTGDSSVVIGIVDSGVDWNHPDLSANIFINNSIDPDYPNDVHGWDFGGLNGIQDNDPSEDRASSGGFSNPFGYHGTHVTGIASAVTNNKTGIASIGYNCSILPVKASRNDRRDEDTGLPYVLYGFEGIKYAADKGAKVINCSWGGYSFSYYEQEIINYAVSKGSLVVAAAGNEGLTDLFYPASYNGVLTVGWLNVDDSKPPQANYGISIDVMAPGSNTLSTWPTYAGISPVYLGASGSSMASPLVAGLAGLVFSVYKNYNPLQVAERIRVTADYGDLYNANPSENYKNLLGRGRINAVRALSETNPVSVRASKTNFIEEGNGNGFLESGETVNIQITFTNYLSSVSGLKVSLECTDPAVLITDSVFTTSSLTTMEDVASDNNFKFSIVPGGPYNHRVDFLLRFSGNGYSDFQWLSVRVNPTYDSHNNNDINLTVTSKGALGFNDYSDNTEGVGLKYKDQDNVLFEGAFMYGTASNKLMDAARVIELQSSDFNTIVPVQISNIGSTIDQVGITEFNDDGAGSEKLGIKTTMVSYSFAEPNDRNYIILRTKLENTTQTDINNLFAGYYFDYDVPSDSNGYTDDMVGYDDTDNFGFAYDLDNLPQNIYIGAALISNDSHGFYAINQDSTTADVSPNSKEGFKDSEKWTAISNGIKKITAGPGDISYVISGGPFNINAGKTLDIAFVLACGADREEVRAAIRQSRIKWQSGLTGIEENENEIPKEFILYQNYPNPFNPETVISYQLPAEGHVSLKIYDLLGREVATLVNEFQQAGVHRAVLHASKTLLSSGVYFYNLTSGKSNQTKKLVFIK